MLFEEEKTEQPDLHAWPNKGTPISAKKGLYTKTCRTKKEKQISQENTGRIIHEFQTIQLMQAIRQT